MTQDQKDAIAKRVILLGGHAAMFVFLYYNCGNRLALLFCAAWLLVLYVIRELL